MNQITADSIAERMGVWTTSEDIEMVDSAVMADVTKSLDEALARKAGHPLFNPSSVRVKDFDMQFFRARHRYFAGNSGLQCLFVHKATRREIISSVELWPRNDFWAILVELSHLA
jgi:hypothetical protein